MRFLYSNIRRTKGFGRQTELRVVTVPMQTHGLCNGKPQPLKAPCNLPFAQIELYWPWKRGLSSQQSPNLTHAHASGSKRMLASSFPELGFPFFGVTSRLYVSTRQPTRHRASDQNQETCAQKTANSRSWRFTLFTLSWNLAGVVFGHFPRRNAP